MTESSRRFLQLSQILELFPVRIRNAIYGGSEYRHFRKGEAIFKCGDVGDFMAAVMSGRLKMSVMSRENKEALITMIERGELFGEMSVFDQMPRAVNVSADIDSTLILIKRSDFMPFLKASPDAMLTMIKVICHRMRLYVQTLELIAFQGLPERLGKYLLYLAEDYGMRSGNSVVIDAHLSQTHISQQLACSRESINKQLHAFAQLGILQLDGDTIILPDIEAFKASVSTVKAA